MCLATTSSADLLGVRRELLPWMQWHAELGVTRFYVRWGFGGVVCGGAWLWERGTTLPPPPPPPQPARPACPPSLPLPPQILYDGRDPEAVAALSRVPAVRLIHIHAPWASPADAAKYELFARATPQWGGRPGNYELMVKQGTCVGGSGQHEGGGRGVRAGVMHGVRGGLRPGAMPPLPSLLPL